ncbi:isoprenylcysteine carboxylmethyltransferase family protein [Gemmatimonas sp.]|uniref:methyltransferase family protein n=1 Tax=Gemmatimonas sp. TaxID=1962908 RepID=UPI00286DAA2A|nr:isoprenylcysteine carboxylmethyltransferase family protein [Gemmatimonas sp.]
MLVVALRLMADATLVALMLFASAGTLAWWRAWVLLGVLMVVRVAGAAMIARVSPTLLRERARLPLHGEQPTTDRVLLLAVLATGFLGLPLLAGLDVHRWHVLPPPAPWLNSVGLVLFVLGWGLKQVALRANAFATTVVRLQTERAHAVVDAGVYAVVRHPFYAADPLILVGLGLWLQSSAAALAAVVPVLFMVLRLQLEERFLLRALPGYAEYVTRVPHRLVPGVW